MRRSSGTRVRSMYPRSSIRSIRPVAFDSETLSTSARRLIGISPLRWSVYMMLSWAMLMPSRTRRSLIAHFIAPIVDAEVGDDAFRRASLDGRVADRVRAGASIVRVT